MIKQGPRHVVLYLPAAVDGQDPAERKTKLAAELANGRLAMMAIIGHSTERMPRTHERSRVKTGECCQAE